MIVIFLITIHYSTITTNTYGNYRNEIQQTQLPQFGNVVVEHIDNTQLLSLEEASKVVEELPISAQESVVACATGRFKSYLDYRVYQNKQTKQYLLQTNANTYTDSDGFRRYNDYYIVAVGSYYSRNVGDTFHIILENGKEFDVMVGDIKQDVHTDATNCYCLINGSVLEFIVDTRQLSKLSLDMGDVSYSGFEGNISHITKT